MLPSCPPVGRAFASIGITLLAGRMPVEIADDLGLAITTVRSHLKRVFAKTGTSRQSHLIRLATHLAGPVDGLTPAG